jgi:hypothetical protein
MTGIAKTAHEKRSLRSAEAHVHEFCQDSAR